MIELCTLQDLPYLAGIEISAGRKFQEFRNTLSQPIERTLSPLIITDAYRNETLWVARNDKMPIGFIAATIRHNHLHIEEFSVAYEYQGKGIGRKLIQHAFDKAYRMKYSGITLTTDREAPWNRPYYLRLGFVEISSGDCLPWLQNILLDEKARSEKPENRIAMKRIL